MRIAAVLALLTAALCLAGCGSSSSSSSSPPATTGAASTTVSSDATQWASTFCTYAGKWKKSLQTAAKTFKNSASVTSSSATAALNSAKNATIEFRTQMSRLGPPPTPNGSQAQQQVQSYVGQLRTAGQTLRGEYQQSASNASEVKQKAESIKLTLMSAVMTLQRAYTSLSQAAGTGQLGPALKSSPACHAAFGKA